MGQQHESEDQPQRFSSEMASHEQNPLPHPHTRHIYFILILRKFTRCETISEAITETRLRLHTCHGHYQFYCSPFLVVSSHLHCGSPKEDLSVDHIWKKKSLDIFLLAKACSIM